MVKVARLPCGFVRFRTDEKLQDLFLQRTLELPEVIKRPESRRIYNSHADMGEPIGKTFRNLVLKLLAEVRVVVILAVNRAPQALQIDKDVGHMPTAVCLEDVLRVRSQARVAYTLGK